MGIEIERKFLIDVEQLRRSGQLQQARRSVFQQGYLCRGAQEDGITVRVRIADEQAYLTIKGPTEGISRAEFEYPLPLADAQALMQLCTKHVIHKTRYYLPAAALTWEIDEFHGLHAGLWLAEIELPAQDTNFEHPDWLGEEVSHDPRYHNAALAWQSESSDE